MANQGQILGTVGPVTGAVYLILQHPSLQPAFLLMNCPPHSILEDPYTHAGATEMSFTDKTVEVQIRHLITLALHGDVTLDFKIRDRASRRGLLSSVSRLAGYGDYTPSEASSPYTKQMLGINTEEPVPTSLKGQNFE